jgi:hypothetical protein
MRKTVFVILATALVPFCAFAIDGVVLINQSTVMAAGGFPYTISQAGSYKLSGNLVAPNGLDGIHITANNVVLDLNGFSITSSGSNLNAAIGQVGRTGVSLVVIRNGTIAGFATPIFLVDSTRVVVEDISTAIGGSGGTGSILVGSNGTIRRSVSDRAQVFCPAVVIDSIISGLFFQFGNTSTCLVVNSLIDQGGQ